MKKILNIFAAFALFAGLAGCSGSDEPDPVVNDGKLTLNADKTSIAATGADKVTFQVMLGNTDVTKSASIYLVERDGTTVREKQSSAVFGSRDAGSFVFEAQYTHDGVKMTSERVEITVTPSDLKEVFYRKIFAQYFTSVGCHNCPNMYTALKNLDQAYKDRLVIGAFHTNYQSITDPMFLEITAKYMIEIVFQSGLPGCFLDLRPDTNCYSVTPVQTTMEHIDRVLKDYPATCGVKIDSKYDESKGQVRVTFTVKASLTNEYRILPFLVEDKIIAGQDTSGTWDNNYEHNNAVRLSLSSQLVGDRLNTIEKDAEATKSYTFNIQEGWNPENLRIVVCVLDTTDGVNFCGNNSATCGINESIDYAYNE